MNNRTSRTNSKDLIRTVLVLLLPFATVSMLQPALRAQTVSFANAQTTVGTQLKSPSTVALDAAGNAFIADSRNSRVLKVSPDGAQTTVGNSLGNPTAVAVDRLGNVFIGDSATGSLLKVTPNNVQTALLTGLGTDILGGAATDAAGDVFLSDTTSGRVYKVTPGNVQSTVGTGLHGPVGLAVDAGNNLFIADAGLGQIVEVFFAGGQTTLASGLTNPYGVAVDAGGNIFVADDFENRVYQLFSNGNKTTVVGGLLYPTGVAVDASGNIFVADTSNDRVLKVELKNVNMGGANVCPSGQSSPAPCSQTITLNYNVSTSGTLGAPVVLTQGAPNLDFKLGSGSTCTGVVAGGSSCTVNVTFAPLGFGQRFGAVQLTDISGKALATTFVTGTGLGPIAGFNNGAQSVAASGLPSVSAVSEDAAGNLYVVEEIYLTVLKISPSGAQTSIGSGFSYTESVVVDGVGNIFVSDGGNNAVKRIAPDGTQTTLATNVGSLQMAVDGAGNLFVADVASSRILEIAPDGTQTTVVSGLAYPAGVAVDSANNLYIAESDNHRVLKVAPGGAPVTLVSGLSLPYSLAVGPAGDVYIADLEAGRVLKVNPDGSQKTVLTGIAAPRAVAVDGLGNLLIADFSNELVLKLNFSQPPSLSFGNATIGNPSPDSPQAVTLQNLGNQPLNAAAPGLTIGANFQQSPGPGTPADCTATFALAPGASCNLSISFVPQAPGNLKGSAVLTDNAMNIAGATQSIGLSGSGILPTATTVSGAGGQYSDKVTLSALVGPAGAAFNGNLQFQVDGVNACSVAVTGGGTYTCSYTISQAAGNHSIGAALTTADPLVLGSNGINTLTVTKEDASITPSTTNPATVQVNTAGGTAGPITLQGTLQQAADGSLGDITKAVATVTLVPALAGAANINCPATNTNGALSAICSNVPVDAYTVQWSIGGNYYQGPAASSVLAVYDPSLGFVTGSGSVKDNGVAADFAISVKYLKSGSLSGGITYIEHRPTGDLSVVSTKLLSMSLVGTTAIISAQATVNGVAGYTLQLNVTDNGAPGINHDTFGLQVSGGTLTPPISFAPAPITAGEIQTH